MRTSTTRTRLLRPPKAASATNGPRFRDVMSVAARNAAVRNVAAMIVAERPVSRGNGTTEVAAAAGVVAAGDGATKAAGKRDAAMRIEQRLPPAVPTTNRRANGRFLSRSRQSMISTTSSTKIPTWKSPTRRRRAPLRRVVKVEDAREEVVTEGVATEKLVREERENAKLAMKEIATSAKGVGVAAGAVGVAEVVPAKAAANRVARVAWKVVPIREANRVATVRPRHDSPRRR
jgi:hypothetical protein